MMKDRREVRQTRQIEITDMDGSKIVVSETLDRKYLSIGIQDDNETWWYVDLDADQIERLWHDLLTLEVDKVDGDVTDGDLDLPNIESVSAAVHEAWMRTKKAQGIFSAFTEDGEELMVPYYQLSEKAKELGRQTVRAVYAAIDLTNLKGANQQCQHST